jgi:3-dehydroquinate synthase
MIIPVNTKNGKYDIVLERGALDLAEKYLDLNRKVLIVTDDGVPSEYAQKIAKKCKMPVKACLKQGEGSKSVDNYLALLKVMLENSFTRKDCVVAVGGGVIGDLAGFVASSYMRGVDFYNLPTTFLSQVDSSIGGKVAIDYNGYKNVVGAFYQPKKVLIDSETLNSLPDRQVSAGLAESIKMATTFDKALFEFIENCELNKQNIDEIIKRSLLIKRKVVKKDVYEKHLRKVLNFGHTIGHAIESKYLGKLLHGECVALGMLCMCSIDVKLRLENVLKKFNLPTKLEVDCDLTDLISHDKKAVTGGVSVVTVNQIGKFVIEKKDIDYIKQRIGEIK